ncbi:MAG: GntR family transcriptional regulator [Pseudomonadota bacterium]
MLPLKKVARENLATRAYSQLREALMQGQLKPGQRLKINELAVMLGVSDTPIREAVMQLLREQALEFTSSQSFQVPKASFHRYAEIREIRLRLEPLAAEKAAALIAPDAIAVLEQAHAALVAAETRGDWRDAVYQNYVFHLGICRAAAMPSLTTILESLWLQSGPTLNLLYPHAQPHYAGEHQHVRLIRSLKQRDATAAGDAIRADLEEGGAALMDLLKAIEDGRVTAPDLLEAAERPA